MDYRDFVPLDYYAANEQQAMLADEDTCASLDRANLSVLVHYRSTEDKAKELILNGATSFPFAFGMYSCQIYVPEDLDANGLTKMRLRLKSFKDNNVQDIIDRHKAVTKLEVVILSKETFSAQQVNYLLKVLNEFGPRLTSFKLWINAVCLPGTQVGSTHLEPIWTAIDKNMPKLEHLTLEIQQTVGSSPNESFTIPVSNILPRLRHFCFGSLDESCECEQDLRMFIALKEGETQDVKTRKQPKLAHIRYSPLVDAHFADSVNCDYWRSFFQLGVANINNHKEFHKFCSSFDNLVIMAASTNANKRMSPQKGLTPKSPPKTYDHKFKAIIAKDINKWKKNEGIRYARERLSATVPDGLIRIIVKFAGVNTVEPIGVPLANLNGSDIPLRLMIEVIGVVLDEGQSRIIVGQSVLAFVPMELNQLETIVDISQEFVYEIPAVDPKYLLATSAGVQALLCFRRLDINTNSRVLIDSQHFCSSTIFRQLTNQRGSNIISVVDRVSAAIGTNVTEHTYSSTIWQDLMRTYQLAKLDVAYVPLRYDRNQTMICSLLHTDRGTFTGGGSYEHLEHRSTTNTSFPTLINSCTLKVFDVNEGLAQERGNFRGEVLELINLIRSGRVSAGLCATDFRGMRRLQEAILASMDSQTAGKVFVRF